MPSEFNEIKPPELRCHYNLMSYNFPKGSNNNFITINMKSNESNLFGSVIMIEFIFLYVCINVHLHFGLFLFL